MLNNKETDSQNPYTISIKDELSEFDKAGLLPLIDQINEEIINGTIDPFGLSLIAAHQKMLSIPKETEEIMRQHLGISADDH